MVSRLGGSSRLIIRLKSTGAESWVSGPRRVSRLGEIRSRLIVVSRELRFISSKD